MEDSMIVELYLRRDESAVARSAEKYGRRLRSLAHGIVRDTLTAEECENDTYLQAWNSIPPHEPRDYLYAFLARISRHIALDRCRLQGCLKRSALISELGEELEQCIPASGACPADDMAMKEAINGFLRALSPEKRNIFLRRYWYTDSVGEIAARCGLSESKVKTTLHRCRKLLRVHLEKEGIEL